MSEIEKVFLTSAIVKIKYDQVYFHNVNTVCVNVCFEQ